MSKAINWPLAYRNEVINEPTDTRFIAVRLGRLYYDNQYWVANEEVDIRVNHKIIRKAVILGDMTCQSIQHITEADWCALKQNLQTPDALVQFLHQTYNQPVTPQTEVTIVAYQNCPIDSALLEVDDDPHM